MCVYVLFTCQIFVKFLWICNFREWGKKKRREEKAFHHRLHSHAANLLILGRSVPAPTVTARMCFTASSLEK